MIVSRARDGASLAALSAVLAACQPTLHSSLPSDEAAYSAIAVSENATTNALTLLQPRDQIDVNVFGEESLKTEDATIDQSGNVGLPLIGEVHAAGLSAGQLAKRVEELYGASYLRNPRVNVIIVKSAPRVVTVEGEVKDPGVFEVQDGFTLLSALALAGSPSETAKLNEVLIFREKDGERYGGRFNLTDIRAGRSVDPVIVPGDVVVVGYNRVRGIYLDFLKTAPLIGAFARY